MYKLTRNLFLAGIIGSVACSTTDVPTDDGPVDDPVLSSADVIFDGAPGNDSLRVEAKADEVFPLRFTDLTELQSSVKSQGSRGVCSIFSTAGYMEHLYIAAGGGEMDFSEQYLQWSVKFEVGSFPNSSGSNAYYNIQAISDYGIPEEDAWPYETNEWGSSDNEACDGEDDQPTECYTNGAPPEDALSAEKFTLPRGRYISTRARDIKAQMVNKQQGVVVGLTFFYQSWNHRRSELPRNLDYWGAGYVLYPNEQDKEISLEKRAGHSILLVGWDDELEIERRDENGDVMTDEEGNVRTETGFFLFKNSWGTGSFGADNPQGDGYGWISMEYVREYGSGRVSDLPEIDQPDLTEVCDDGVDNDNNGASDCDDAACVSNPLCEVVTNGETLTIELTETSIPDNDERGLVVPFTIDGEGVFESLVVDVDVTHTYSGDLSVSIETPEGEVFSLLAATGRPGQNLTQSLSGADLVGVESAGEWKLIFTDHAAIDTGDVNSAVLRFFR